MDQEKAYYGCYALKAAVIVGAVSTIYGGIVAVVRYLETGNSLDPSILLLVVLVLATVRAVFRLIDETVERQVEKLRHELRIEMAQVALGTFVPGYDPYVDVEFED